MNAETLQKILENHKKWLTDNGGERANLTWVNLTETNLSWANLSGADLSGADLTRADLSGTDLSGTDLSGANLTEANLTRANLTQADLTQADLTWANLTGAHLSWANLTRANLSGAHLSWADLSEANLTGAKGLLSAINYLDANFERTADGYIAYKTFGGHYSPPENWKIEKGSVITEVVNPDRCTDCGSGINVAPIEWVKKRYQGDIWKCLIRWEWLAGVIVPYMTDGKIRCEKVELVEIVADKG